MRTLLLFAFLATACYAQDLQTADAKILITKDSITAVQSAELSKAGHYKYVSEKPEYGYTLEIHEYVAPQGKGWLEIYRTSENKVPMVKVIDRGGYAKYREHDWQPVEKPPSIDPKNMELK